MHAPEAIRTAAKIVSPDDFYYPHKAGLYRAVLRLHTDGEPVEPLSVYTKAVEMGVMLPTGYGAANIQQIWMDTLSAASAGYYAEQIQKESTKRKLKAIGLKLCQDVSTDGFDLALAAAAASEGIKALYNGPQRMTTKTLEEILAIPEDHDWLIPNLLERGDRLIITGYEGGGKTTWVRQMALCMAAGIHPTTLDRLAKPLVVLVVDAENTESQWRAETRGMVHNIRRMSGINPATAIHVYARGRIDITKNATLGEIHRLVDIHEPDVLTIGPIYKLVSTSINNDQEAAPVITALDSLRDRGLALLMEGHSAKGNQQAGWRDLSPRGSAALMGWPEFGFGINAADPDGDPNERTIQRWRGDREVGRQWPRTLHRGGLLPWMGDTVTHGARHAISLMQEQDHYSRYN
jgi:replicative DNA helicase